MNKNLMLLPLIFASSMTVSLSAFATKGAAYVAPAQAETSRYHNGFYIGGSIGGNQYVGEMDQDVDVVFEPFSSYYYYELTSPDLDNQSQNAGFGGQIQLGYALFGDTFFIAAEISGNGASNSNGLGQDTETDFYDSFEGITVQLTTDTDINLNSFEPVIDIKPGFKVGINTLLYARVGVAFNEIEIKNKVHFSEDMNGDVTFITDREISNSESVAGLRLGAGMEHRFSEHMAVNVDYVYTTYGSVDVSGYGDIEAYNDAPLSDALAISNSVNVSRDMVMIGLNYYF